MIAQLSVNGHGDTARRMKAIIAQTQSMPRIYRHFAIVTLAVTALVGIFADGENREAIAQAQQQQSREPIRIKPPEKKEREGREGGSFGSVGGRFGTPMVNPGGSRSDAIETIGPSQVPARTNPTGLSDAEFARLSPKEREALIQKIREQQFGLSPEIRARQIENLVAASTARSGAESNSDFDF